MSERFQEAAREFLADHGRAIESGGGSTFGWEDYDARVHVSSAEKNRYGFAGGGCRWVIPQGAVVRESTRSMFMGTFEDNKDEVGLNISPVSCACGLYEDVTLRWVGSVGDLMEDLFHEEKDGADPSVVMRF